jgi:ribosomal protein S18 acetylase RimI-like enzyme
VHVRAAVFPDESSVVRELFEAHAASLDVDIAFQRLPAELAGLPGRYVQPSGGLWLAVDDQLAVGCIALRPFDADRGEIKRLYLRPTHRGRGLGRRLAETAVAAAASAGYERVVLDTLPSMAEAIALYRSLGFREIDRYNDNPTPGTLYFELRLNR